jgi:phosphoribosylamine--glycine ligase
MDWARPGLIINLYNGSITKELDRYKEYGFPVFGPSAKSSALEVKRSEGMKALEKQGVKVPPYKTFNTLKEAMEYAKKSDKRLVFKTLGDEEDKSLSYCAHDPEDMVWRINSWIEQGMTLKGHCMLQDFIEGIEVGVSRWMGSEGFIGPYNVNFEFKKMMNEDYGPATGEMGTVCKYVTTSKLGDEVLMPMEKTLRELGHIGDTDLNCIIDDFGDPYCLEFTNRFGWPSTQILCASHKGDPIKWMKDAIQGKDTLQTDERTAIGVLMAAPPFPYPDEEGEASGLRISGIEDEWNNVAPWQVELSEEGEYLTTGPYVCLATALAPDVHDAIPQVYASVDKIKFPNRIVRSDIGKRLESQLPKLHAMGFEEMPHY